MVLLFLCPFDTQQQTLVAIFARGAIHATNATLAEKLLEFGITEDKDGDWQLAKFTAAEMLEFFSREQMMMVRVACSAAAGRSAKFDIPVLPSGRRGSLRATCRVRGL